jgi:FMN-dependent NADH-azoreductase
MTHILHIDASPRGDRSISRTLSHEFIHAEGFESGDEARSLVIANAKSAIKSAISMSKSLQRV